MNESPNGDYGVQTKLKPFLSIGTLWAKDHYQALFEINLDLFGEWVM